MENTLLNQFHDILPGTAIHEVYEQTKRNTMRWRRRSLRFLPTACRCFAPQGEGITVFNTTGKTRSDIVVLENCTAKCTLPTAKILIPQQTENGAVAFLPDLPPKGYKCFAPVEAGSFENPLHIDGSTITTPFYTVEFDENGSSRAFMTAKTTARPCSPANMRT